jgi:hypothetical protein
MKTSDEHIEYRTKVAQNKTVTHIDFLGGPRNFFVINLVWVEH